MQSSLSRKVHRHLQYRNHGFYLDESFSMPSALLLTSILFSWLCFMSFCDEVNRSRQGIFAGSKLETKIPFLIWQSVAAWLGEFNRGVPRPRKRSALVVLTKYVVCVDNATGQAL